ncbi:MAG: ABC transporter permease, partial [Gemmatimonadota bacterium]
MAFAALDAARRDWSYALRALRRTPGFTVGAVLILGLGIGMTTAMLSVFNSALLQKLPVREQDRLVVLWPVGKGGTEVPFDSAGYETLRGNSHTMEGLAGFAHWGATESAISDGDQPLHVRQALVTGNFFSVLGAAPVLGRLLQPSDDGKGTSHVMVISYSLWQSRFHGDRSVIGKQLSWRSAGWSYTIVGVAPPGLDYPIGTDYWAPAWAGMWFDMVGRLKPGATPAAAQAELADAVKRKQEETGTPLLAGAFARPLTEAIYGDIRPAMLVMTAAAGLLLLIACTNVGNLLLLRAAGRVREIAVRRALGASRSDIFRQFLAESTVLGLLGGALGLGIASGLLRLFTAIAPQGFPRADMIRVAGMPLVVGIAVTLATVILTGLAPLMSAGRADVDAPLLRLDSRAGTESRGRRRVRQALVAGQVALALVVLAGASLLTRSLIRLERLPLGLTPDRFTIVQLIPPVLTDTSYVPWIAELDRLLPAIRSLPGVVGVTPILAPPFTGSNTFTGVLEVEGRPEPPGESSPRISFDAVGADFFRAFDLPLLRGRGFTDADRIGTPLVAVVTNAIARRSWPGEDPIGKRVRFLGEAGDQTWRTVIGVSEDVHFREFRTATPMMFVEYHQMSFWQGT